MKKVKNGFKQKMNLKSVFVLIGVVLIFVSPSSFAFEYNGFTSRLQKGKTYIEIGGKRMVKYNGQNNECQVYGVFAETGKSQPKSLEIGTKSMTKLVNLCQDIHSRLFADSFDWSTLDELSADDDVLERRQSTVVQGAFSLWSANMLDRLLIFPGTKWCGKGSVAENYFDLGVHKSADMCCRNHDLCLTGESIEPGQCKNGLCNFSPISRSSCSCDAAFAKCLQTLQSKIANTIGRIFFNYAGLTCYKYDYPIKRCNQMIDATHSTRLPMWILQAMQINPEPKRPRCRRYELDTSKPKRWQYFETVYDENQIRDESRVGRAPKSYPHLWNQNPESPDYTSLTFLNRIFFNFAMKIFESSA